MTVISLLVGLQPYRLLLATQPLQVLRRDVVARVWPLKFIACCLRRRGAARQIDGRKRMLLLAVLAGAVILALLCGLVGWMLLNVPRH